MRKLLLLVSLCFGAQFINAQEISTEQWSMVTKKTATWCTFCGQWGWDFKKDVIASQQNKPVLVWSAHFSGDLDTETSKAIINNLPNVGGQPIFYLNNDIFSVNSGNASTKVGELSEFLDAFGAFEAFAGVGSTAVFDGEKITTNSKVRFLVDLEADANGGQYYLASYLVDDVLIAFQQARGNNAEHENIILHSFNGDNHFGVNVFNGSVTADQEFTSEGELDFTGDTNIPDYADGYSVVTILWTKIGDEFVPFNINRQDVTSESSNTNDVLENVSVAAFHLGTGQIDMNVTSDKSMNDVTINLFDINGRAVATKAKVKINEGDNQIILESQELTLGTYIVNIQSELGSKSLKVSVR